jgi:Zn-dependent M28 family amino/carboxypeptidase
MPRVFREWSAVPLALLLAGCGDREFDEARSFRHLVAQVEIGPRVSGTPGHARALESYRAHLEPLADRVFVHEFDAVSPLDSSVVSFKNVVAVFRPDSPTRVLFSAHWDTRPVSDQDPDPARRGDPVPGANDGASGVAVLLEVATALAARPPAIGVDLVLFDGEDQGRPSEPETYALGSQEFVRAHPEYRPAFVVNLDMVGRKGLRIPKEPHSVVGAAWLVERVWAAGRDIGSTVLVDSLGPPVFDDHVAFLRAGIPAVDLIDLRDPNWHTTADLPEACAPESLGEVGRLVLAVLRDAERTLP